MSDAADRRDAIRSLIARTGRLLDAESFDSYIELFTPDALYEMKASSSEIGREMTWLTASRDELADLLTELPDHVRDPSLRTHVIAVEDIELNGEGAKALSTFSVFRTDQQGESAVYAVGRYEDDLVSQDGQWRIGRRTVRVQTRKFVTPTPTPL